MRSSDPLRILTPPPPEFPGGTCLPSVDIIQSAEKTIGEKSLFWSQVVPQQISTNQKLRRLIRGCSRRRWVVRLDPKVDKATLVSSPLRLNPQHRTLNLKLALGGSSAPSVQEVLIVETGSVSFNHFQFKPFS